MQSYNVELEFLEPMLGTVPKDKEIYKTFIASKAPNGNGEEEEETVQEAEEKGWTGFHEENGVPFIYDYMIKGFFKDACSMLRRVPKSKSSEIKAYRKILDGLLFVTPRKIMIDMNGGKLDVLERPIRITGPTGERVALTRSDMIPAGSKLTFQIKILGGIPDKLLTEWMDYGENRGLGQWRNAGYGSFKYTMTQQ